MFHPELRIFIQPALWGGEMIVKFNLVDEYDILDIGL